jgi:hypothetical protein
MSGYLQYSNYGDENENQKVSTTTTAPKLDQSGTKPTQQKRILRTNHRTLRSKPTEQGPEPHKYVQELIQKIHSYENGSSSDSDDDDYAPLPNPNNPNKPNNSMQQQFQTEPVPNRNRFAGASGTDLNAKWNPAPAKEAFSLNTGSGYAAGSLAKANQPYVQSVFQASDDLTAAGANKDILLEKLDHIISLLENQHDEKTGHVTEELVLYCFLGVFIIFIVDSFARAGKYVR